MSDTPEDKPRKKKGKAGKLLMIGGALVVLVGGGVGAGLYAAGSGLVGGGGHPAEEAGKPRLVPKSEQKTAAEAEEAGEKGGEEDAAASRGGKPVPEGSGGEPHASNYYAMEKEFTANLRDSVHFIQVGVAISTPYDDTVIERLKTHDIAIRSAVLLALGETPEDAVFSTEGKTQLQRRLAKAINETLEKKEGFGGVGNVYFTNFVVQ